MENIDSGLQGRANKRGMLGLQTRFTVIRDGRLRFNRVASNNEIGAARRTRFVEFYVNGCRAFFLTSRWTGKPT